MKTYNSILEYFVNQQVVSYNDILKEEEKRLIYIFNNDVLAESRYKNQYRIFCVKQHTNDDLYVYIYDEINNKLIFHLKSNFSFSTIYSDFKKEKFKKEAFNNFLKIIKSEYLIEIRDESEEVLIDENHECVKYALRLAKLQNVNPAINFNNMPVCIGDVFCGLRNGNLNFDILYKAKSDFKKFNFYDNFSRFTINNGIACDVIKKSQNFIKYTDITPPDDWLNYRVVKVNIQQYLDEINKIELEYQNTLQTMKDNIKFFGMF